MSLNKKTLNKVFIIALILLTVILFVFGIWGIRKTEHEGAEQVLSESSQIEEVIRNTENQAPLTDEQFLLGVNNIIPRDNTDPTLLLNEISSIDTALQAVTAYDVSCEYINFFGNSACYICLPSDVSDDTIKIVLLQHPTIKYAHIDYMQSGKLLYSKVWKDNTLLPLSTSVSEPPDITELLSELTIEYGITSEDIINDVNGIQIKLDTTVESSFIDIFDYCYQWAMNKNIYTQIKVYSNEILYVDAIVNPTDSNYINYYPVQELAPYFRLTYYYSNSFLKGDLRKTCQLYI